MCCIDFSKGELPALEYKDRLPTPFVATVQQHHAIATCLPLLSVRSLFALPLSPPGASLPGRDG